MIWFDTEAFVADDTKESVERLADKLLKFMDEQNQKEYCCVITTRNPDATGETAGLVTMTARPDDFGAVAGHFLQFAQWMRWFLEGQHREPLGEVLYTICLSLTEVARQVKRAGEADGPVRQSLD